MTRLLITDIHNNVLGALLAEGRSCIAYTPFGYRRPAQNLPALGFNGQRADLLGAAYHLGHGRRTYSPALMRFHQADAYSPFAEGGVSAYAYCLGDPVNFTDASGRFLDLIFKDLDPKYSAVFSIFAGLAVGGLNVISGVKLRLVKAPVANAPVAKAPPLPMLSKVGTNTSLLGSFTTVAGGVLQIAGIKEGRYVSAIGAGLSGSGAVMSGVGLVRTLRGELGSGNLSRALGERFWVGAGPRVDEPIVLRSMRRRSSNAEVRNAGAWRS